MIVAIYRYISGCKSSSKNRQSLLATAALNGLKPRWTRLDSDLGRIKGYSEDQAPLLA
jgi:hypothetical protein